ncbi:hypothetical protein Hokovirus_3_263 [Hokovirus HKV1]|uniref:Sulfotransferase family protein n=1 Tax=Hokovirus HKV1 TaxID=1977638 RepID=A0A1V0SGZ2_9VIRU|nr:hypothetical protein Hokovirus_3_263 [Hokovirus HKV1]
MVYIFNISFQRNATTSFNEYMVNLGFNSIHDTNCVLNYLQVNNYNMNINECRDLSDYYFKNNSLLFIENYKDKLFEFINNNQYQVFSDNPWPIMYKELDQNFDCKFILFVRNPDKWLNSMKKYFNDEITVFRKILYDGNINNDYCKKKYIDHNESVINYFKNKNNLLVIDLDNDTDIDLKISEFLDIKNHLVKFPLTNVSS